MANPRAYSLCHLFWYILFLGWLLSAWILECAGQEQAANRFDQFDLNQDGQLTREELPYRRLFQRLDRDGDGLVSSQEASRYQRRSRSVQHPAIDRESWAKLTDAPTPLTPGELGLGRQIPDLAYTTLDGNTGSLQALAAEGGGVVIAMTSATCPVSKRYLPRLLAIHDLPVLLVNPFRSESSEQIKAGWPADLSPAQYVHDLDQTIARALDARTTTEVFLLDGTRTLLYRGAVDDQYGVSYIRESPRRFYLQEAMIALQDGTRPRTQATEAPGCELDLRPMSASTSSSPGTLTYHRDVARILQQYCVECHRDGGIAPFALDDAESVLDRTGVIRRVVESGQMPPWSAKPVDAGEANPWSNDPSLSAEDRHDLLTWLASDSRTLGDPADAPAPRSYPNRWSIGEPDLVIPLSREYQIPATGVMPYQIDRVEVPIAEDRWVSAYEILPTARDVVHHVLVFVRPADGSRDEDRNEAGGYWAAYVPGNGSTIYPSDTARRLPAGSVMAFQIHYTPNGKATRDRLQIGLQFADEPPRMEVKTWPLPDRQLDIPPGVANHLEQTEKRVAYDLPVISIMGHMHNRGKAFACDVTYPDGQSESLLEIPQYDFNWQLRYEFKHPKFIPAGSRIQVRGLFDNSAGNPANPDPTKRVRWGQQTHDEMLIGYLEFTLPLSNDAGK